MRAAFAEPVRAMCSSMRASSSASASLPDSTGARSNEDFEQFKKDMDSRAYEKYKHRELVGCPPNMASCASSSRMIYYAARDIKGFEFEKLLPAGGEYGTAHLDGYLSTENYEIFVEAKCHEMFSSPKKDIAKCYQ